MKLTCDGIMVRKVSQVGITGPWITGYDEDGTALVVHIDVVDSFVQKLKEEQDKNAKLQSR